jgi:hypothetical protein
MSKELVKEKCKIEMKIEKKINIITKEYKIDEMNNKNEIK